MGKGKITKPRPRSEPAPSELSVSRTLGSEETTSVPHVEEFPWASEEVSGTFSDMSAEEISGLPAGNLEHCSLWPPSDDEPICSSARVGELPFFFFYRDCINRIKIRFPFSAFQISLLQRLSAAPSQIHPNAWGFIQAFEMLCSFLGIPSSLPVFFHFFTVVPSGRKQRKGWTSIRGTKERRLLTVFTDSFKNFKSGFFKVVADPEVHPWFLESVGGPGVFPLYWDPSHYKKAPSSYPSQVLTVDEQNAVDQLSAFVEHHGSPIPVASVLSGALDKLKRPLSITMGKPSFMGAVLAKKKITGVVKALPVTTVENVGAASTADALKRPFPTSDAEADEGGPPLKAQKTGTSVDADLDPVLVSPSSTPSPPSPLPQHVSPPPVVRGKLWRDNLWRDGVTIDLAEAVRPPVGFFSPKVLSSSEAQEVESAKVQLLKAAGLLQLIPSLKEKFAISHAEHLKAKRNLDEVAAREAHVSEQLKSADEVRAKLEEDLAMARSMVDSLSEKVAKSEEERIGLIVSTKNLQTWLEETEEREKKAVNALATAEVEAAKYLDMIASTAEESFQNAVEQMQYTHPDLALDPAKIHWQAYVEDGKHIWPSESGNGGEGGLQTETADDPATKDPRDGGGVPIL